MRNNYEYLKTERQMKFLKKQVLLYAFKFRERKSKKIHFINANMNAEKVCAIL